MSDVDEERTAAQESDTVVLGRTAAPDASSIVRALLRGRHGEHVRIQTPGGTRVLSIVDIVDDAEQSPCEGRRMPHVSSRSEPMAAMDASTREGPAPGQGGDARLHRFPAWCAC